jgi:hypothetical protein
MPSPSRSSSGRRMAVYQSVWRTYPRRLEYSALLLLTSNVAVNLEMFAVSRLTAVFVLYFSEFTVVCLHTREHRFPLIMLPPA